MRDKFENLLFDLAKIMFAGGIVSMFVNSEYGKTWIVSISATFFILFLISAVLLHKTKK